MYEFFPGSGDQDDLQSNIINEPLDPLWKSKHDMTMGMVHRGGVGRGGVGVGGHGTRSRTSSSKSRLENNPGEQEILPPRAGRLCYREVGGVGVGGVGGVWCVACGVGGVWCVLVVLVACGVGGDVGGDVGGSVVLVLVAMLLAVVFLVFL